MLNLRNKDNDRVNTNKGMHMYMIHHKGLYTWPTKCAVTLLLCIPYAYLHLLQDGLEMQEQTWISDVFSVHQRDSKTKLSSAF